jgi:multimeric flavodoxin WrbA
MTAVQVLGVLGSPHRHGNTELLLDRFLEGALEAGGGIEKVVLADLQYRPCRGCNACHKTGVCVLHDDAIPLIERMTTIDCCVIASPIYSMGITAELKGLVDRAQYLWAQRWILKTRPEELADPACRRGVFLSTAGLPKETVFDAALPVMTAFFHGLGFAEYDRLTVSGMDRYGGVRGHPTALDDASALGVRVVSDLESRCPVRF